MLRKQIVFSAIAIISVGSLVATTIKKLESQSSRISTGRYLSPVGSQTEVGSFPANMVLSPDGKFIAVLNTGFRQQLSIIDISTGKITDQRDFNADLPAGPSGKPGKQGLYFGADFAPQMTNPATLYISRGNQDQSSCYSLNIDGKLTDGPTLDNPAPKGNPSLFMAGVAVSGNSKYLYACNNETNIQTHYRGSLSIIDITSGHVLSRIPTPGFPYAVKAITKGELANKRVYVTSERDAKVSSIDVTDPEHPRIIKEISSGAQPIGLLLNKSQSQLFIANSGSDTVSIVETKSDRVLSTILVRPEGALRLPGATPIGLALSPDETRLFVTLADMNAVALVDLSAKIPKVVGMIPTGWYPTSVIASPDGKQLFVANAKGVNTANPNKLSSGPKGEWGQYIENLMEGTVSRITLPDVVSLRELTARVLENNQIRPHMEWSTFNLLPNTGIKHVVYIVKENRTYDEILGDMPKGNGDPSMVLFGRNVTPNQHALADRFLLLDNFYCSGEVSGDGWNWSTSGMASEYVVRNLPFNYSGRGRSYDFEGSTNGYPVDIKGMPDVARAPGGYIWDGVDAKGLSFRNYGFYCTFAPETTTNDPRVIKDNKPSKRTLVGHTDENFYHFDMNYTDSNAWIKHNCPTLKQRKAYGEYKSPSRFAEWKREFDLGAKINVMPTFSMVRFCRDHTEGTTPGFGTPRAMVADNDYAVGQLVETISKSKFWASTAIFVLEDDAQDGFDHVDGHRSSCYVISPLIKKSTVDHHFYNTDSVLKTMEALLSIPPMSQYDASAPILNVFGTKAVNKMPFTAILPDRAIISEINQPTAYRATESASLDFSQEDRVRPEFMRDVLWHSVRGR